MDELILLPEGEAERLYLDSFNGRALFRLLPIFTTWAIFEAMIWFADGEQIQVSRSLASLILIRWLYYMRERPFLAKNFRPILLTYLSLQMLLLRLLELPPSGSPQPQDYLLPACLLFFRLPAALAAVPLATLWAASAGSSLLSTAWTSKLPNLWPIYGQSAIYLIVLAWVARLTRRLRARFLETWRREHRRHRERSRMRDELDDARKIQLNMLPRADPKTPWLDIAGISIPASEVGGDYFDYFELEDGRFVVVVGDVAGHGLASSLLLSGIRSCLHLLQESPMPPVEILSRLDRMVRKTTDDRIFVTLLYALFDPSEATVTFAAAGHPPPLQLSRKDGSLEEHSLPALPLGTKLRGPLQETKVHFASGDVFALFTDGIAETTNALGETYGNERLQLHMRKACRRPEAKEIRDSLLGDVWKFKGDGQQMDDITVVVMTIK